MLRPYVNENDLAAFGGCSLTSTSIGDQDGLLNFSGHIRLSLWKYAFAAVISSGYPISGLYLRYHFRWCMERVHVSL